MSDVISIITPFKNEEFHLEDCANSIRNQTHQDFQWILVDDHSTDQGMRLAKQLAEEDARIEVYENKGEGIVDALTTAEQHCKGSWVTRMDADDVMTPDKLEVLLSLLKENPDAHIATACVKYFSKRDTISEGYKKYEDWLNRTVRESDFLNQLYRECPVCSSNWMISTHEHRKSGGFSGLQYPEDYDLVFRWVEHGLHLVGSPVITHMWREYPERTSRTTNEYSQQAFFELKSRKFMAHYGDRIKRLMLLGVNTKTKLLLPHVKEGIAVISYDQDPRRFGGAVDDIRNLPQAQNGDFAISCVHPKGKQFTLLKEFVHEQGYEEGKNFWFF